MTELQLYKFITENSIEWSRKDNNGTMDVMIFPYTFNMEEFVKLIGKHGPEEGIECVLANGYFAIWMNDVCNYFDIDPDNVFVEQK